MKILFLTDNFPPESNAPAIRTFEHARHWARMGHDVTIITCAPNFPAGALFEGYRNRCMQREEIEGIAVVRVWTFISRNEGFLLRTLDYVSFMLSAIIASLFVKRPDVVIATSPQFFTSIAGWIVSLLRWRPFVFELRDLWPETVMAVDAMQSNWILDALERLAHFLYRRADLMVPVTHAFANRLRTLGVPDERIEIVTNGIDPDSIEIRRSQAATREKYALPEDAFVAGYIGTLGMCHGLSTVLEAAQRTRGDSRLHFVVMGDGADRDELIAILERERLENVTLIDRQPRAEALEVLNACDVSLVMLRESPVFETVIPSKIFEAMALRKPILLGVRGEAKRIVIDEAACGTAFPPEDADALIHALQHLMANPQICSALGDRGHAAVVDSYQRSVLAEKMIDFIEKSLASNRLPDAP
jgi:glycosyltransferase involved in cell wall biosynthesis